MAALEEDADEAEDIFDPGLFLNEDYAEHSYELGEGAQQTCLCLEGASTDHDLTGQVVWPVSVALARFVAARLDSLKGRRVVEVGAGTALAGLAAARSDAASVVLTDGSDVIMQLLERALASSNVTATLKAPTSAQKLLWGDRASFDGLGGCDVVLGADVVCWPRLVEPLLQTVRALLRGSDDGVGLAPQVSTRDVARGFSMRRVVRSEDVRRAARVVAEPEFEHPQLHIRATVLRHGVRQEGF